MAYLLSVRSRAFQEKGIAARQHVVFFWAALFGILFSVIQ